MFPGLMWATGVVLLISMAVVYVRYRDPLHPMMFMGPLFLYAYVYEPATLHYTGLLAPYFSEDADLVFVQALNLVGVTLFCLGCLSAKATQNVMAQPGRLPSSALRHRLFVLAMVLGGIGLLCYGILLRTTGGLVAGFSSAKGGLKSPSGYISESVLLTIPALVLVILAGQGERWSWKRFALIALFAFPHLFFGIVGTRRGPTFGILVALVVPWLLVAKRPPPLRVVLGGLVVIGLVVLVVFSQRKFMYIGSEHELQLSRVKALILPTEDTVSEGNNYIHSGGLVLTSRKTGFHYWGRRYAITLFVRPVPRQLWPTKYRDAHRFFNAMVSGKKSLSNWDWEEAVGWHPLEGSAAGMVADMYFEFAFLGLGVCFLMGVLFGRLWRNARLRKGIWILLYVQAALLSIYVPTQSVSAFIHRFCVMSVPTLVVWRFASRPQRPGMQENMVRGRARAPGRAPAALGPAGGEAAGSY